MGVTQKCQYALRALFELAKREGAGATKSADLAISQAIPKRFLEVILHQLRQGGFVEAMDFVVKPGGCARWSVAKTERSSGRGSPPLAQAPR